MPTPRPLSQSSNTSPSPSPRKEPHRAPPQSSPWTEEQQKQFMAALLNGNGPLPPLPGQPLAQLLPPAINLNGQPIPTPAGNDDPLAALMASFSQFDKSGAPPGAQEKSAAAAPRTWLQKLMPFVHLLTVWSLLGYFVFWKEPAAFEQATGGALEAGGGGKWSRWAELAWSATKPGRLGVQLVVSLCQRSPKWNAFMILPSLSSGHSRHCRLRYTLCALFQVL